MIQEGSSLSNCDVSMPNVSYSLSDVSGQVNEQAWTQQQVYSQPEQQQLQVEPLLQQYMDFQQNNISSTLVQLIDESFYSAPFEYSATESIEADLESKVDIGETSVGSTVEDGNTDTELACDEPFTYLQGLNSDNLMQFSQQSVLQEMMLKEQLDIKPNLDVLPTFEEHDIGGYNFRLNFGGPLKGRVGWMYSEPLNKVYLRMNEIFSIDAVYKPKMPLQQLRIRVLMCFVKEVSEPVLRCQNHISKDQEPQVKLRHSLLRCENPSAEYCGSAEGKSINDRYSVLIPLGQSMPKNDSLVKQTIALKFTCQNSCIGRKETSIIFLLEGMNGEILSQRVIDVKICSCPKRDKAIDERNIEATKRKPDDDIYPGAKKVMKQDSSSTDDCLPEEILNKYNLSTTPSGSYRLVMEIGSKDVALRTMECAFSGMAEKALSEPHQNKRYSRNYRYLKRLYERALKLSN